MIHRNLTSMHNTNYKLKVFMCCTLSFCIKIISLKISKSPELERIKTKKKLWTEIKASRSVYFIAMLRKIIQNSFYEFYYIHFSQGPLSVTEKPVHLSRVAIIWQSKVKTLVVACVHRRMCVSTRAQLIR